MSAAARSRGRAPVVLGVDLGGTTTAVGVVTRDGDVIADASAPTDAGARDPLETIVALIAEATEKAGRSARSIGAVGVGVAGPEGDDLAASIVDEACQGLGAMMGTIVNGLNPEVLIVTGGVVESFAKLEAKLRRAMREYAFAQALAATRIDIVPGDKRASVRGAAALASYEPKLPSRRRR
jgi:predicted NBD/HSP70 family sugar kinase